MSCFQSLYSLSSKGEGTIPVTHPVDPLIFNIYSPCCIDEQSNPFIWNQPSDFSSEIRFLQHNLHLNSTFISQGRLESNTKFFRNNHVLRAENFASARKKTVPYEKCEFCRLMTED